jgi:dTDP-4-dehydrorhamnose reductase
LAKEYDRYVLHLSTDFVFGDLVDKPQTEDDTPNPLNVYGTTKLEGEKLLFESGCRAAVIRLQWTYGRYGKNFISKMIELARTRDKLNIVSDQVGGMTNVEDVSKTILCFLEKETLGLYHFAADGYASRYEVTRLIFAETGIEISCEPCSTADLKTPARRPLNSRFDCSKIDKVLDFKRPAWDLALKEYLRSLKN